MIRMMVSGLATISVMFGVGVVSLDGTLHVPLSAVVALIGIMTGFSWYLSGVKTSLEKRLDGIEAAMNRLPCRVSPNVVKCDTVKKV